MELELLDEIHLLNPWLKNPSTEIIDTTDFIPRVQLSELISEDWDNYWTILIGPRRAGKTTIGKLLAQQLLNTSRFAELLYLNCDLPLIRKWLSSPTFISEAIQNLELKSPILFIDEAQRIENAGLLLKAIIDLGLPIKHIATGSSQLEMKSKVQEFLTGRQLTSEIYPLSYAEWKTNYALEEVLNYGCYPQVLLSAKKELQLNEIYSTYIKKDIIEILKIGKPDVMQDLLSLIAHSSGQLINYNQLATDCKVSVTTIRNYLEILEQTFVIKKVTPFVGNKRTEITSNPIYYFIDNGFRNAALRNFSNLSSRSDLGLLIESFVFQELFKFNIQNYLNLDLHFWRTKSGAEVDFVLYKNSELFLPIEVKYRNLSKASISRGFRSFIEAYQPKHAIMITKNLMSQITVNNCKVHLVPLIYLSNAFKLISDVFL